MLYAQQQGSDAPLLFSDESILAAVRRVREPLHIIERASDGARGAVVGEQSPQDRGLRVLGTLPPLYPEWLGDRSFGEAHGVRFPYAAGEMANGIASARLVGELARADLLGFFGAAGLSPSRVETAVVGLTADLGGRRNWGVNLIHTPMEPGLEDQVAEILLRHKVPRISTSAFLAVTPAVVRCAVSGLQLDPEGQIVRRTAVFAKVSRPDIAELFMSPAPAELLRLLRDRGQLTEEEAALAAHLPVAEDVTVEADSAGHTDNRPLVSVLPTVLAVRDAVVRRHGLVRLPRVGAAGGLGDPAAVAGAFALGASYVLTGSVNQMAVEADLSDAAKEILAQADVTDVVMAPAPDMFELGVQVQVLRRGSMYAPRATRLYRAYRAYDSLEAIDDCERRALEEEVLGISFDEAWALTRAHWKERDPGELARAGADPRHRMALLFRWYLGQSSRWAISGDPHRRADYQLWCGPAAGAFNRWAAGSLLADPAGRSVVQIARNLLEGAAVVTRAHQVRSSGVALPPSAFDFRPRRLR
jgi:PfaD family protein